MIDEKAFLGWMQQALDALCEKLSDGKAIPESGTFRPFQARFPISGTENIAVVRIEAKFGAQRQLRFFAQRRGTDLAVSYFMESGTNAQLRNYLRDKDNLQLFVSTFCELSESVDGQEHL